MIDLLSLKHDLGEVLAQEGSGASCISVRERANLRWWHFENEAVQSIMDSEQASFPVLPYAQAMCCALAYQSAPKRVLSLGLGGGTLERFLCDKFPQLELHSVESDERVIDIVKAYFALPVQVQVSHVLAEEFVSKTNTSYDIIFCDLFDVNGLSAEMKNMAFYEQLFRLLPKEGVLAINTLVSSQQEMLGLLLVLRAVFPHVCAIEVPNYKNIILFAFPSDPESKVSILKRERELDELLGLPSKSYRGGPGNLNSAISGISVSIKAR